MKKIAITLVSSLVAFNVFVMSGSVLHAATVPTPTILDYVYDSIIPGKYVLMYTINDPEQCITSQDVIGAFQKVGIAVTNAANLPETIVTGTEIKTASKNYTVLINGDVNADGYVDVFDSQRIVLHEVYGGANALTGINLIAGNVLNDDTDVDVFDAQRIVRFWVGFESKLMKVAIAPKYDTTAPVITLKGESNIILTVGSSYTDAGATATDNRDDEKEITGIIYQNGAIVDSIDTSAIGDYQIKYNITDKAGNKATEMIRKVSIRRPVTTLIYTDADTATKELFTNSLGNLLKVIKVDSDEMAYDIAKLKAYVTRNGAVLTPSQLTISFVKNGNNIEIYADTKTEIGNISIIPYLGETYDATSSVQGLPITVKVMNPVTNLQVSVVEGKPNLRKLDFYNNASLVDIMLSEILVNPVDTTNIKDGQIVILTTGNVIVEKKTVDESNNIVTAGQPHSIVKYLEIKSMDANEPEGTIEIRVANNPSSTKYIVVEKTVLKAIKLPYGNVSMVLTDPEDVTLDKIQNREVIKKTINSKLYLLVPIEFYQDAMMKTKFENITTDDVYIKAGCFAPDLVENKITFTSNNNTVKVSTKLFAVVNNDLLDVTKSAGTKFDYVAFSFQTDVTDLEITVSYGNITDSSLPGYVQPSVLNINKTI